MEEKMEVRVEGLDNPYADQIRDFFLERFPGLTDDDGESRVDGIMRAMMGSGQVRYGPKPSVESQALMREIVRWCIAEESPIPILVPMGPKKPAHGQSVDIAELSMLHTLARLRDRVQRYHPPGIDVRFRVEDFTGHFLESHVSGARESMALYMTDFENLIELLGFRDFMTPRRESDMVAALNIEDGEIERYVERLTQLFALYLVESTGLPTGDWENLQSYAELVKEGWQGVIPEEMRTYYRTRFERMYPEMTAIGKTDLMATYFAVTLARRGFGYTGAEGYWGIGPFQINFVGMVPGTPRRLISTRLFYRTLPLCHSKRHLPFWRSRGYLRVNGEVRMGLATWGEDLQLHKGCIVIRRGSKEVRVQADYLIV